MSANETLSPLAQRRVTAAHAFFLGALMALIALAPAILPYGGRFVTRGDFIEQQLPFLAETRRILRGGLDSYSFCTFLGAPAVGSYAFYTLGSPFVWPLALLPQNALPFAISVMAVLKHAVCALCAFLYLRRMVKDERLALLGCALYAFSSFTVVNTQFYHFTEVVAFFPLILLGLEDAMGDAPRPGLLALACGLNALVNYYFMLASALLAALYFVFRFFSDDWRPCRTPRRVFFAVFECAVGCALSGVLLLPAMRFMLTITRTGAGDVPLLAQRYTVSALMERLRALLMPIESGVVHAYYGDAPSWTSTAAHLPAFGLTGVLVFFARQKKNRWLKALLALLFAFSAVPALCGAFALFTNTAYTRWWYGLALMLTLATLYALRDVPVGAFAQEPDRFSAQKPHAEHGRTDASTPGATRGTGGVPAPGPAGERPAVRAWLIAFAVCAALIAALTLPFLLPQAWLGALAASSGIPAHIGRFLLNRRAGAYAPDAFRALSLGLTLLGGGALLPVLLMPPVRSRAQRLSKRLSCSEVEPSPPAALQAEPAPPTVRPRAQWLGKRLSCSEVAPALPAAIALVCAVACAQYAAYIAVGDALIPSGGETPGGGKYALSQIAEPTLSALALPEQTEYKRVDYGPMLRNYGLLRGQSSLTCFASLRSSTIGRFIQMAGFGYAESTTVMPPDGSAALRALLSVSEYHQLDGEDVPEGFVYDREENGFCVYVSENAVPMGFLQTTVTGTHHQRMDSETVASVLLAAATLEDDQLAVYGERMRRLDVQAIPDWQESAARLRENACDRFTTGATGFTAHIDAKEAGLLVFTIPYDKGFTATVDGEAAEIVPCDVSFMAVWIEPGEHEIAFTHRTRSLRLGIAMSLTAAILLGAYVLWRRRAQG